MTNENPSPEVISKPEEEKAEQERLDRSANEMAGKASKTEKKYDGDHGIFTK